MEDKLVSLLLSSWKMKMPYPLINFSAQTPGRSVITRSLPALHEAAAAARSSALARRQSKGSLPRSPLLAVSGRRSPVLAPVQGE